MDTGAPAPRREAAPPRAMSNPASGNYGITNSPDAHALQASLAPVQPHREIPDEFHPQEVAYRQSGAVGS